MTHRTPQLRLATTAIAAVLALSSTQLLAQTAPDATQPATTAPAIAVPESAPTVTISSEPLSTSTSEPLAPVPTITKTKSTKSTTTRRAATVARPARAVPPAARVAVAAPAAAPIAAPAETAAPAPVPVAAVPAAPPPVVAATPPAEDSSIVSSDMLLIAGVAALGLLALIVVGLAMRRRRRRRDEEFAAAETYEPTVDGAPAQASILATPDPLFAEPAFAPLAAASATAVAPAPTVTLVPAAAMGAPAAAASAPTEFLPEGAEAVTAGPCADAAPGSHVEAACEGPTEDNPSLSIKKRLKRAQFFDQREQLAAAGMAVPMASDAGLPDAVETPARSTVAVSE